MPRSARCPPDLLGSGKKVTPPDSPPLNPLLILVLTVYGLAPPTIFVFWTSFVHLILFVQSGLRCSAAMTSTIWSALDAEKLEIRLATLSPNENMEAKPCIHLKKISLKSRPTYEALSWVWGDPTLITPILLEDNQWPVPINLGSALRHLRDPVEEKIFWIDAICIDQNNAGEKAAQIQLMDHIYSVAQAVRIWLGEAADDSDDSMEVLRQISAAVPLHKLRLRDKILKSEDLLPLGQIFRRPWWRRVWVIQEYVLARKATFVCGRQEIDLCDNLRFRFEESFKSSSEAWCSESVHTRYKAFLDDFYRSFGSLEHIRKLFSMSGGDESEKLRCFAVILAFCQRFESSKEQDKIYGVLALSPAFLRGQIPVEYKISKFDLNQDITFKITKCLGSLTLFDRFRLDGCVHPTAPTWASDWSLASDSFGYKQSQRLPKALDFNACASQGLALLRVDARIVRLKGVFFDKVSLVGPVFPDQHMSLCTQQFQNLQQFYGISSARSQKMRYVAGNTFKNAFWRTMMNDKIWRANNLLQRCQKFDEIEFHNIWQLLKSNKAPDSAAKAANVQSVARILRHRRAIHTERGYVGMAAEDSLPGDSIYMLAGGSEPFILRSSYSEVRPKTFVLIGTSYVHGVMDGEAVSETSKTREMTRRDWQRLRRFGGHLADTRLPLRNFVDLFLE